MKTKWHKIIIYCKYYKLGTLKSHKKKLQLFH